MHKTDANHAEIRDGLRAVGCIVADTASMGGGFPDLVVGFRGGIHLVEIKDGNKPPSKRTLTAAEERFHAAWDGYRVHVVESLDAALAAIGAI